jgi:hypothetical protein
MNALRSIATAASLAGAAVAFAAAGPVTSDQFAAGWQAEARGLINQGPSGLDLAKSSWFVPGITPPGKYVLIERHGDRAELIDGYQLSIRSGAISEIHVMVPAGYANVEVLPVKYLPPDLASRNQPSEGR